MQEVRTLDYIYYFLAAESRCTPSSLVSSLLSRESDGWLNGKNLKVATPSGQEVNAAVFIISVSSVIKA